MKIGIDIRTLMDKEPSGVSSHTLNLVKKIIENDKKNQYILFYNSFKNIEKRIPNFDNVKIVKTRYPNKIFNILMQGFLKYPKLDKYLKVDTFLMPNFSFIALSKKCKKILVVHDLSFIRYKEFFSFRMILWHKFIKVKKQLKNADKIIAVSKNTKNDIIELFKIKEEKIKVIYPGLDKVFKEIDKKSEKIKLIKEKYRLPENYLLYLGTLEPRKNIIGIIKAYELFRKKNPDFKKYKLVIAGGKGWKSNKIFKTHKESKYYHDIIFPGYINKKDKIYVYSVAKIFLFPSFFEGFGFPPLEAMACGIPAIVGNNSSLSEAVGDSAIQVNPYKQELIAKAIEKLLKDKDLNKEYKERGLKKVLQFNWSKTYNDYSLIFFDKI
jgi:glycosyltransferase involved in cell wall biosynthesis